MQLTETQAETTDIQIVSNVRLCMSLGQLTFEQYRAAP